MVPQWYQNLKFFLGKMRKIFKSFSKNILGPPTPPWSPHMKKLQNFYDFYLFFGYFGPFWAHRWGLRSKQRYLWYPKGTQILNFLEENVKILKSFFRNILGPPTPSWSPHMKKSRNFYDFQLILAKFHPPKNPDLFYFGPFLAIFHI